MTQLLNMPASTLAQAVLRPRAGAKVSCYWCRKLLRACDGQRTVAQVAELLHLPLQVCLKLMKRAHQQGWAELSVPQVWMPEVSVPEASGLEVSGPDESLPGESVAAPLWDGLLAALGPAGEDLLSRAAQMSRCQPRAVPLQEAANFLIGVELLLPESRRDELVPVLDRLRNQYAV